jgi:geranylgeranyl reductase family protein
MNTCDVLIAGGGPAGSACAWRLRQAGIDVLVMDKAVFPRDKVCAGWITPQVIEDLALDVDGYRAGRTFQPITGFRVGLIGSDRALEMRYERPVSYGVRRCEFDDYLLKRSNARLLLGTAVTKIRRDGRHWVVNESVRASMLVGAGGHFCPVARTLSGENDRAPVIAAQEVEFAVKASAPAFAIAEEVPELYFCPDLKGYGWCFRKEDYLNIGFGRLDSRGVPKQTAEFVDFLKTNDRISRNGSWRWKGHAYLLAGDTGRPPVADGVVLIGDAAGLAYPQSGEGIRPAIESGLMAASTIVAAQGSYARERLEPYERGITKRFAASKSARLLAGLIPSGISTTAARWLLTSPLFVRHMVLNRWFLHAQEQALV